MYAATLRASLPRVRDRIEAARLRAGRGDPVGLVAVTKGHPLGAVEAALAVGLTVLGENRVQELEEKANALVGEAAARVEWHLIGHLQRNKVRRALPLFRLLHSLDSLRLARELSGEAGRAGVEVRALVEVNTSGEEAKAGFSASETVDAVGRILELPGLRIEGLMTMAPWTDDEVVLHRTFGRARRLFEDCAEQLPEFRPRHLSMGMSNDFEIAVEEGSTMVRLGTVLFGEREQ